MPLYRVLAPLLLQLIRGSTLNADSSSHDLDEHVTLIKQEMDTLIENHSLLMDVSTEQDLQKLIVSKFRVFLVQLAEANDSSQFLVHSDVLTNKVIIGVYKTRGHAIKYMLSSGKYLTVEQSQFESLLVWSTDLLVEFLRVRDSTVKLEDYKGGGAYDEVGVSNSKLPMDLAVQLGMLDVLKLLVQDGGKICSSFDPLECTDALHYATISQDTAIIDYVVELVRSELAASSKTNHNAHLCKLLTHIGDTGFVRSPLDIAHYQCSSGLKCNVFEHLLQLVHSLSCNENYTLQGYPYGHMTCSAERDSTQHFMDISLKRRWLSCIYGGRGCKFDSMSGSWKVYGEHRVGGMDCNLPRISAAAVTPFQFERDFVNMRYVSPGWQEVRLVGTVTRCIPISFQLSVSVVCIITSWVWCFVGGLGLFE